MANSNLAAFLLFLIFFTSIPFPHTSASPNDVVASYICPNTRNPPFCSKIVHSAATADLKILAGYTLNLARATAGDGLRLARSLAATAADRRLKQRYSSCAANYDGAFAHIGQARKYLADGAYDYVADLTSGVAAAVEKCLGKLKLPPRGPSAVTKKGNTVEDLCSIVLVLAELLPGTEIEIDGIGN
ncbi:pectinesterase inhibitor-like [Momordica charantia]|uniref:Pectinesterase inhibitor-like n=1 Tax=Momordica charantia TaxID=3673 RepID=A0A6J1D0C7_MOMCH|nr:pectinesterase inhibitor-like [Momordica charantia]